MAVYFAAVVLVFIWLVFNNFPELNLLDLFFFLLHVATDVSVQF